MNSLMKGEGVLLVNFEGGPGVSLLNFKRGPGSQGRDVLFSLLHHAFPLMITKLNPEMANAQHPVTKIKLLSAMINDQWYAMEWSELLCQLNFGMKVHEANDLMKCYCV